MSLGWDLQAGRLMCVFVCVRINGQLVALKVIRMKTEEGVPFTAIREGGEATWFLNFCRTSDSICCFQRLCSNASNTPTSSSCTTSSTPARR